jgi:hypothetical protein
MSIRDVWPLFASGAGMMLVAVGAVLLWWRISRVQPRWFWIGAAVWSLAVALKILCALVSNKPILHALKELPQPLYVALGAGFIGVQSSVFEMGLTLLAVMIWRQWGRDADRAITIGLGAGAIEAFLLSIGPIATATVLMAGASQDAGKIWSGVEEVASITPLYWLAGPAERTIAILCHASTRALVILGFSKGRPTLVIWGFLLFTLLDGVAGGVHVAGLLGKVSLWWIELAIFPCAVVSIPILAWCRHRWPSGETLTGKAASSG